MTKITPEYNFHGYINENIIIMYFMERCQIHKSILHHYTLFGIYKKNTGSKNKIHPSFFSERYI